MTDDEVARVVRLVAPARVTYTVDEVADMLGVSRGSAYAAVRAGVVPGERIGRRWVVPHARFHSWLGESSTSGEVRTERRAS